MKGQEASGCVCVCVCVCVGERHFSKLENEAVACACVCLSGDRVRAGAFPRQMSGAHLRVPQHPGAWV